MLWRIDNEENTVTFNVELMLNLIRKKNKQSTSIQVRLSGSRKAGIAVDIQNEKNHNITLCLLI